MDLVEFEHTKRKIIKRVYNLYLKGYSIQDIRIITKQEDKVVNNIIDCCNHLYQ